MILLYCAACGDTSNLYQHHLIPRTLGGSDDPTNLITLCGTCHAKAHDVKSAWHTRALTSAALSRKKVNGERVGHVPYGSRLSADGIHLDPSPAEQFILQTISDLKKQGLPFRQVANELNARGLLNRGNPWRHVAILRASKNAA